MDKNFFTGLLIGALVVGGVVYSVTTQQAEAAVAQKEAAMSASYAYLFKYSKPHHLARAKAIDAIVKSFGYTKEKAEQLLDESSSKKDVGGV